MNVGLQNKITISGQIVADPETNSTQSGVRVRNAPLYVGQGRDRDGNKKPTIKLRLTAWEPRPGEGGDDSAYVVLSSATKGQMITVEGRLTLQSYRTQDGTEREQLGIVAELARIEASREVPVVVERRPQRPPPPPASLPVDDDEEIPF